MNKDTTTSKWYESSTGDGDLSLTIKSVLVACIPLLLGFLESKGVEFTQSDAMNIVESILAIASACSILFGLFRKLYFYNTESGAYKVIQPEKKNKPETFE